MMRKIPCSSWLLPLLALFLLTACTVQKVEQPAAPPARDGVFIHITHGPDTPHDLLMPLKMAEIMAADHDVLIYFDLQGVYAVLADAPDASLDPFPSLHEQLQNLVDQKITLMACPSCLKVAGKTPQDLREGVQVADKRAFFDFTKGRILTLDY